MELVQLHRIILMGGEIDLFVGRYGGGGGGGVNYH